jgi:tetratricopeptide (TPR) repeat protein
LAAGCRTVAPSAAEPYFKDSLTRKSSVMAEALANYGMGVLREGMRDSGSVSNYLRAIQLEPSLSGIYLRAAVQHIRSGNKDQAISIMENACRSNPKSIEALLLLSQIYQMVAQPANAQKAAQRAIDLEPGNYKGYVQLASFYIASQNEKQAMEVLKKALPKVSEPLSILRILGDLHVQQIYSLSKSTLDIQEAIRYYEKAVAYPTDDLSLVYLQRLGDLYLINHQPDKAIGCFQKIAVHDPDNIPAQQKIALCYMALENKKKALETLKNISGRVSDNADLYYYLGELYDTLGDQEHAIESYKAASNVEPLNPKSYLKMALIHLRNNPEKAREVLQDGLKRMPKERLFLEILLQLYLRNQQYGEALALFDKIQSSFQSSDAVFNDPRFYIHYGLAAQQCNQLDKAMVLYTKALDIDPRSLEARMRLANLELWRGNRDEALGIMEDAVIMDPDDAATWFFCAILNLRAGEYQQAAEAFKKTEELAKLLANGGAAALDFSFYFNYGAACERSGNWEKAETMLLKSIALNPENSMAFNYLAYMWAEKGINLDKAMKYVSSALEIEPDNGAYLDTLGWVLFKKGQNKEALAYLEEARVLMPDDPTILEHVGDVLLNMGNTALAVEFWKNSFRINPTNADLGKKLRENGIDVDKLRNNRTPITKPLPLEE